MYLDQEAETDLYRFRFTLGDLLAGTVALAMLLAVTRTVWQAEREPSDFCSDVAWSPDGRFLAGAFVRGGKCCVAIYDAGSGDVVLQLEQAEDENTLLRFSQDSRTLIVASHDLSTWDVASGRRVRVLDQRRYNALSVSPDGIHLAAARGRDVVCWDLSTGAQVGTWGLGGDPNPTSSYSRLIFAPDGQSLLVWYAATNAIVRIDLASQKVEQTRLYIPGVPLLAFGQREPSLLVVSDEMTGCGTGPQPISVHRLDAARLADPDAWSYERSFIDDGEGAQFGCISSDGTLFASLCRSQPGAEWRRLDEDQTGVCLFTRADYGGPLAFSPDNQRLAMGVPTRLQVAILSNGRQVMDLSVPWMPDYSGLWTGLALSVGALLCVWYIGYRAMGMAEKEALSAG